MIVYLDTSIAIYLVEQPAVWGSKSTARLAALRAAGDTLAVSDLTRMECQVAPLMRGDTALMQHYDAFFRAPGVRVMSMTAAVFDRAARIRATYRFRTPDALHLAAAAEHGCGLFLTSDLRLSRCADIRVEVLS